MLIGIVGCGGFGREVMPVLHEMLGRTQIHATLVFVETTPTSGNAVNGYRVMSEEDFFRAEDKDKQFNIAIADSRVRQAIAERFIKVGVQPVDVHSLQARFYDANKIGEGSIICAGSIVTSNAIIGRFFHCNIQSYVAHDCVVGDFVTFAPRVACNGNVVIEDHAYIGTGAVIKEGMKKRPLRIGKGAIVGMGAVVTKDVPAGETWVGNPARPLAGC
ncbi:MAG: acetyltransferase [Methylocystis sp.]|uniref:acetyltransferase n=1 Tax=Methylocystis sp. TaxID=1911079 RepID=UPI003DA64C0F